MGRFKKFRDAITGHYMKEEEAVLHPDTSVAESTTKRKRKPRPKPVPDDPNDPNSPNFHMKMDVVFKGEIYTKERKDKLPEESKEYLMGRDPEWSE